MRFLLIILYLFIFSCDSGSNLSAPIIEGCTDESACNYDMTAIEDDGSCTFDNNCGECFENPFPWLVGTVDDTCMFSVNELSYNNLFTGSWISTHQHEYDNFECTGEYQLEVFQTGIDFMINGNLTLIKDYSQNNIVNDDSLDIENSLWGYSDLHDLLCIYNDELEITPNQCFEYEFINNSLVIKTYEHEFEDTYHCNHTFFQYGCIDINACNLFQYEECIFEDCVNTQQSGTPDRPCMAVRACNRGSYSDCYFCFQNNCILYPDEYYDCQGICIDPNNCP